MSDEAPGFDEMGSGTGIRAPYAEIARWLAESGTDDLMRKRREAEHLFRRIGITFAVYGEGADPERLIPFDIIPRILARAKWDVLRRGLEQRVRALNLFLADIYANRDILRAASAAVRAMRPWRFRCAWTPPINNRPTKPKARMRLPAA